LVYGVGVGVFVFKGVAVGNGVRVGVGVFPGVAVGDDMDFEGFDSSAAHPLNRMDTTSKTEMSSFSFILHFKRLSQGNCNCF